MPTAVSRARGLSNPPIGAIMGADVTVAKSSAAAARGGGVADTPAPRN